MAEKALLFLGRRIIRLIGIVIVMLIYILLEVSFGAGL